MPAQTTGTLTAPSVAFTVPLAEIAFDHTGKPISRSDFTSRHPASMTRPVTPRALSEVASRRSEEHTSELQSPDHLVCPLLLEKKKNPHLFDPNGQTPQNHRGIAG